MRLNIPLDLSPLPNEAEIQRRRVCLRALPSRVGVLTAISIGIAVAWLIGLKIWILPLLFAGTISAATALGLLELTDRQLFVRGYLIEDRLRLSVLGSLCLALSILYTAAVTVFLFMIQDTDVVSVEDLRAWLWPAMAAFGASGSLLNFANWSSGSAHAAISDRDYAASIARDRS